MFCRECGAKIPDDSPFCFRCRSSTALPAGSPVAENVKNKGESPNTGAEKRNENDDNGSFDGINAYNQKIQARQKKKRIWLFIGVGVLLVVIMGLIISFQTF